MADTFKIKNVSDHAVTFCDNLDKWQTLESGATADVEVGTAGFLLETNPAIEAADDDAKVSPSGRRSQAIASVADPVAVPAPHTEGSVVVPKSLVGSDEVPVEVVTTETDLEDLNGTQIDEQLRAAGLPTSGKVDERRERLSVYLAEQSASSPAAPAPVGEQTEQQVTVQQ